MTKLIICQKGHFVIKAGSITNDDETKINFEIAKNSFLKFNLKRNKQKLLIEESCICWMLFATFQVQISQYCLVIDLTKETFQIKKRFSET